MEKKRGQKLQKGWILGIILSLLLSMVPVNALPVTPTVSVPEPSLSSGENRVSSDQQDLKATVVNPENPSGDGMSNPPWTRVVVKLTPEADPQSVAQQVKAEILRQGPLDYVTLGIKAEQTAEAMETLRQTPGVLSVNLSQVVKVADQEIQSTSSVITDTYYSEQWGLKKAEVPQAWELGASGEGVTIAIVDTGVDINHPDLKGNLIEGYNAITGRTGLLATQDNNGHGTHVAGIAAAAQNGEGIVGVAPQAKIMPIKAMDRAGEGTDDVIADGIIWAADHGAKIINLSLGSDEETDILKEAIQYAQEKGSLVVAAAGNKVTGKSFERITFPASEPGVLAVTASDSKDQIASFSRSGPQASLAAPGVNIISDYWQNRSGYAFSDGTSMASPFVAGVAALVWSAHPELTAGQVRVILENSALDLGAAGRDFSYGYGRVNAYWAVQFAANPPRLLSPARVGWAGGEVEMRSQGESTPAQVVLKVPARAFGSDPEKEVTVTLSPATETPDFPAEITPVGAGVAIDWEGSVQKILTLSVSLQSTDGSQEGNSVGTLYRWTGTRWIPVGGGASNTISAGITEPGVYRVGFRYLPEENRLAGADRIETAIQISQRAFPTGTDTVLLARADDFPDALAGAPLAYKYHAPILLTDVNALSDLTLQEINRLAPKKIILLGGTGAISPSVEVKLKGLATIERLGGANRYETAAQIAATLGLFGEAVVVNGMNYPDAISMAAIAAQKGIPILLTDTTTLPRETDLALRTLSVTRSVIAGGSGVISAESFQLYPTPTRLAGEDRYSTTAKILETYPPEGTTVFLATGENFPDALTGGVLAAMNSSRIILVSPNGPNEKEISVMWPWSGRKTMTFGGSGVVSDEVVNQVNALVQ